MAASTKKSTPKILADVQKKVAPASVAKTPTVPVRVTRPETPKAAPQAVVVAPVTKTTPPVIPAAPPAVVAPAVIEEKPKRIPMTEAEKKEKARVKAKERYQMLQNAARQLNLLKPRLRNVKFTVPEDKYNKLMEFGGVDWLTSCIDAAIAQEV